MGPGRAELEVFRAAADALLPAQPGEGALWTQRLTARALPTRLT